ncbi:FtsK/SpoIIIE family DNA translocase [Eupransor demetentiae]|uniref:DNA segregation ATPase FtsK/SpoIIIE or related protein (FtsK) n=1 Tax=Eupransor demetentiae TaxID=3109584 RepID=A0ABM9N3L5_9LACO|nr:DNA segregation ATPase FtsK/SpoIIIE or related protein (FtsK) [Lactobacillaceae bacterium LMG 33000]
MAGRPRKKPAPKRRSAKHNNTSSSLTLLALIVAGIFAVFKLGIVGIYLADIVRFFIGDLYQVILIPLILYGTFYLIMRKKLNLPTHVKVGLGLILFAAFLTSSLFFFTQNNFQEPGYSNQVIRIIKQDFVNQAASTTVGGGIIGALLYQAGNTLLSNIGVVIIIILTSVSGVIALFRIPARDIAKQGVVKAQNDLTQFREEQKVRREERARAKKSVMDYGDDPMGLHTEEKKEPDVSDSPLTNEADQPVPMEVSQPAEPIEPEIKWNQPEPAAPVAKAAATPVKDKSSDFEFQDSKGEDNQDDYQLPSTDLLTKTKPTDQRAEYKSLSAKSRLVHDTLASFGVEAEVTSVSLGPTVTQYELKPGQGVKVNRIANLADDLALALAAKSIRIEAPIPGKPFVGIEVPNDTQAVVGFRDMMEQAPKDHDHLLKVPLGRDVTGNIVMADLASMPHLLIAGSTGSGKSVGLNGIIISLLLKAKPNEVKLMMVDPKVVELSIYNGIPHLLSPVVSDPRKAAKSLQKLVDEMEDRYKLLAQFGKRNINEYNQAVDEQNAHAKETGQPIMHKMPYIVAIVDEFADLMSTVGSEIEVSIARLGAKARAAGIHMILATQRPDVKVINGTIKSNIPGRIAFRTASGIDSRTILDTNGAEKLLGRGDMIFAPPGKPMQRLQGAFISNQDVTNVVNFVKNEQEAEYSDSMTVTDADIQEDESGASNGQSDDELFDEALAFVVGEQKASTSLLQRRFRIGYNRAARLIDDLEAAGYIGPADGARPRHVNLTTLNHDE